MTCMCGDLYCGSCGPAQGNSKCSNCGMWTMDGGCETPAACAEAITAQNEAEYQQWKEDEESAANYWREREL